MENQNEKITQNAPFDKMELIHKVDQFMEVCNALTVAAADSEAEATVASSEVMRRLVLSEMNMFHSFISSVRANVEVAQKDTETKRGEHAAVFWRRTASALQQVEGNLTPLTLTYERE